uniref:Glutamine--fructose-6-phosphate aminotransferase [isomerizing] n=1 Tax=Chromera velia CCMP2878 TaxID=1169474 RepID=A0A0G4HC19_9ALVE|eukprot:Cvel_25954.t1-p1 / transcript=Cvel_25954.t1 / gene=Cvel_25954 / organism=Chromera_velia_CCMP2878 / gene_product=Glutamine--fructose-6-phosphate aminotransferase, putative / transcript_product=Glutamine--fructose-6-phosphate aminotransferase, putative / location=Cvel_scaffold3009:3383-12150(-) / protein_length=1160 / sequence_SO=supercontig / SO=protein_coding / is_pseudo=false
MFSRVFPLVGRAALPRHSQAAALLQSSNFASFWFHMSSPHASASSGRGEDEQQRGFVGADMLRYLSIAGAAGLALFALPSILKPKRADCCGIVGYMGHQEAQPILMDGIKILQNRGYDSAGMATLSADGRIISCKFASKSGTADSVSILESNSRKTNQHSTLGIAHTRWATHGAKTDENAHPHCDYKNRIALVHNGTIENYAPLKKRLQEEGAQFHSQTDTEVIANLIGSYLDKGLGFEQSVAEAIGELTGTWGLCIVHKDHPDKMVVARNGSPLLVAAYDDQVFVASESSALARNVNQYVTLKDGEMAVVTRAGIDHLVGTRPMQKIHKERVQVSPDPYPHWTLKEIHEQPKSLARALNYGGRIQPPANRVRLGGMDTSKDSFLKVQNLVIAACGTSMYAGIYGQLLMQWLGCLDVVRVIDASECDMNCFPKTGGGLLLLSQSGETLDVIRAAALAEQANVKTFSVVNVVGSALAQKTGCGVYLNAGREVAVASTKAFTSQVTVLTLIAAWFAQMHAESSHMDRRAQLMDSVHRLPVYAGMTVHCEEQALRLAERIKNASTMFVLGKGFAWPVALEGALKIKEISYIHAEGFPGGALKHGPFALIDEKARTPVILIVLSDEHTALMRNAAEQVKARGAHLIVITDNAELVSDLVSPEDIFVIPSNGPLTALLAAIPLQLLAYHLAVLKGNNPDYPRGLAKTVTVVVKVGEEVFCPPSMRELHRIHMLDHHAQAAQTKASHLMEGLGWDEEPSTPFARSETETHSPMSPSTPTVPHSYRSSQHPTVQDPDRSSQIPNSYPTDFHDSYLPSPVQAHPYQPHSMQPNSYQSPYPPVPPPNRNPGLPTRPLQQPPDRPPDGLTERQRARRNNPSDFNPLAPNLYRGHEHPVRHLGTEYKGWTFPQNGLRGFAVHAGAPARATPEYHPAISKTPESNVFPSYFTTPQPQHPSRNPLALPREATHEAGSLREGFDPYSATPSAPPGFALLPQEGERQKERDKFGSPLHMLDRNEEHHRGNSVPYSAPTRGGFEVRDHLMGTLTNETLSGRESALFGPVLQQQKQAEKELGDESCPLPDSKYDQTRRKTNREADLFPFSQALPHSSFSGPHPTRTMERGEILQQISAATALPDFVAPPSVSEARVAPFFRAGGGGADDDLPPAYDE